MKEAFRSQKQERKKHFAEFSRSTPRGREFALLTILFLRAGALILETVNNSLTEHEKEMFVSGRTQVQTVMVIDFQVLTA